MSEEVSGSSEVINPDKYGELWSSSENIGLLLDLLVASKKEALRSQWSCDGRPSKAISLILVYLLVVLSLGMIYALSSVLETTCEGPLPT